MNLYLVRHGKACERSRKWRPDSTRPLTAHGEARMKKSAKGLEAIKVEFDLILTSPYVRALRTAEILGDVFGAKKVFETKNLVPDAEPAAVLAEIRENFSALENIALVSHEPLMGRLASVLLSGKDGIAVKMRKGGCGKFSLKELKPIPGACLEWFLTPKQMIALSQGQRK
jgi:phosphohistidine phosphatase